MNACVKSSVVRRAGAGCVLELSGDRRETSATRRRRRLGLPDLVRGAELPRFGGQIRLQAALDTPIRTTPSTPSASQTGRPKRAAPSGHTLGGSAHQPARDPRHRERIECGRLRARRNDKPHRADTLAGIPCVPPIEPPAGIGFTRLRSIDYPCTLSHSR